MKTGLVAVLAAFLLAGCSPIMDTQYDFVPPASDAGMQCVQNCQQQQSSCQRADEDRVMACRQKADREADLAYEKARDKYIGDLKLHAAAPEKFGMPAEPVRSPYYGACQQSSQCQADYQMCYRSCGGRIDEKQVCVAFCD
ncbi:MAG: hypothetical protein CVT81_14325 [Alphaproteobacteria bacterium HGW-Alphaproteobacteria-3]|nr:MAG: hypothetical protein CVT81_14325 [Alphaproteobacteria bacterium HGW-Alphaproteobacteria-3]